jgi:ABC-2 type transport system ATP-binding protein
MKSAIIELEGLTKFYGSLRAVDNLHLNIYPGEIFGLLGPNGAGKTTTILMMLGLTEPSAGIARVCGFDATREPISVKRKVGYMPDNIGFYDNMTAFENLMYIARLNGVPAHNIDNRVREVLELVGLSAAMHKPASAYSRGMKQRLGLADVLIREPEVIILDEPTLGIDPTGVKDFLRLIRQLSRQQGITVLLSSHHLHQVQQVCDRVGIFVGGKLLAEGDIHQLSRNLFAGESYQVSITVGNSQHGNTDLEATLRELKAVSNVDMSGNTVQISCTENITPALVRMFVEKGFDVMGVHQKEHGLEEIYQRYFDNNVIENETRGKSSGLFQRSFFRKTAN